MEVQIYSGPHGYPESIPCNSIAICHSHSISHISSSFISIHGIIKAAKYIISINKTTIKTIVKKFKKLMGVKKQ